MTAQRHKTLQLLFPITVEDREVSEVTITRPKVKDLKAMDAALVGITDKLDQGIVMVSVLTGLPTEAVEELDADDFTRLSEEVAGFSPRPRRTGLALRPCRNRPLAEHPHHRLRAHGLVRGRALAQRSPASGRRTAQVSHVRSDVAADHFPDRPGH